MSTVIILYPKMKTRTKINFITLQVDKADIKTSVVNNFQKFT